MTRNDLAYPEGPRYAEHEINGELKMSIAKTFNKQFTMEPEFVLNIKDSIQKTLDVALESPDKQHSVIITLNKKKYKVHVQLENPNYPEQLIIRVVYEGDVVEGVVKV